MVMPFGVLFSTFGMGVALMGIQICLSGQVRDQIHTLSTGIHGDIQGLHARIDKVSDQLREVRRDATFIKGHLSSTVASGLPDKVERPEGVMTYSSSTRCLPCATLGDAAASQCVLFRMCLEVGGN
ncbi:hypothetical protein [Candidatus Synechococcus spongiarum]|nr:hypothetical protein [Candidatus Synechococcus spongiarum]